MRRLACSCEVGRDLGHDRGCHPRIICVILQQPASALLGYGAADLAVAQRVRSLLRELADEQADVTLLKSLEAIRLRQADVALSLLGGVLLGQKKYADAEPLLLARA